MESAGDLAAPAAPWRRILEHVAVLLASVAACGYGSVLAGKDNNYDLRACHYYLGFAGAHSRAAQDVYAAGPQSYFNAPAARPPRALAAAALLGIAVGGKLTAALFVPGFVAMVALIPGGLAARARRVLLASLAPGAGFLAVNGHNSWSLYQKYGNPTFPFFNGYFRSPYSPCVNFRDPRWGPRDAYERWLYPYCVVRNPSLASEVPFRDYRFVVLQALLAVVLAAVVLRCCRRVLVRRFSPRQGPTGPPGVWSLIPFTAVSYVVWVLQFGIQRYIAALELLVARRRSPNGWTGGPPPEPAWPPVGRWRH